MDILNQEKIALLANEIGKENIPMLFEIFIGELASYAQTLSTCSVSHRSKHLSEISHALKSSAASFGADKLCSMAQEIDARVKQGKSVDDEHRCTDFIALLNITQNEYSAYL